MSFFATQRVEDMVKPYSRRWISLGVLCLSLMVILMANLSISVAAETLTAEKNLDTSQLQWVIDGYTVPYASLMLVLSLIGDKFGRRMMLNFGLLILAAGGVYGAVFAQEPYQIIIARIIMGIGAAMIMPATLSLLVAIFPQRERPIAITIWSSTSGVSMVIGPLLAGYLLKFYDWQVTFTMAIPPALVLIVLAFIFVPPSKAKHYFKIDLIGGLLSVIWVGSLVYAAIEGPHNDWQRKAIISAIIAGVGFILFIIWELVYKYPLMNIRRITNRYLSGSLLSVGLLFFVLFGMFFAVLQLLQFVYNLDPFSTGVRLLPLIATVALGGIITSILTPRIGMKFVIPLGIVVAVIGLYFTYRLGDHPESNHYSYLVIPICLLGLALGLCISPATNAVMDSFAEHRLGVGGALNDTAIELGGSLGIAILGSVLSKEYTAKATESLAQLQQKYFNPELLAKLPPKLAQAAVVRFKEFAQYIPGMEDSVGIGSVVARKSVGTTSHQDLVDGINSSFTSALSKMSLIGIIILVITAVIVFIVIPFGRGAVDDLVKPEEIFEDIPLETLEPAEPLPVFDDPIIKAEEETAAGANTSINADPSLAVFSESAVDTLERTAVFAETELGLYAAESLTDNTTGTEATELTVADEIINRAHSHSRVAMSAGLVPPSYQATDSNSAILRSTNYISTTHLRSGEDAREQSPISQSSRVDKFAPQVDDIELLAESKAEKIAEGIALMESQNYSPAPGSSDPFVASLVTPSCKETLIAEEIAPDTSLPVNEEVEFFPERDYREDEFTIAQGIAVEKTLEAPRTEKDDFTYDLTESSERDYRDEIDFQSEKTVSHAREAKPHPVIERVVPGRETILIDEDGDELDSTEIGEFDSEYYALKAEEYAHDAAILEDESAQAAARANFYATKAREFAAIAALNAAKAEAQALKAEDHARKAGIAHYGAHSSKEGISAAELIKLRLEQSQRNNHL